MVAIFPLPHPRAIRFPRSNRQISTSPISSALQWSLFFPCHTHVPLDFPSQIVKPPTSPISSALQWSLFSFFSVYIIFLLCLPLYLFVLPPRGRVCNCSPSSPFWAVKLWGRAVPSASPVRHNGCHRFPKSNRQISTSPISSALQWSLFSFFSFYIIFLLCRNCKRLQPVLSSEAVGASSSKRLPGETQRVP